MKRKMADTNNCSNLIEDSNNFQLSIRISSNFHPCDEEKAEGTTSSSSPSSSRSSSRSSSISEVDSDLDEVLIESLSLFTFLSKPSMNPLFFMSGPELLEKPEVVDEIESSASTYDPTPPPRNQIIGATREYVEKLRCQPGVIKDLIPEFTLQEVQRPFNLYWNFPRAVLDYNLFEHLMSPILPNGSIKKLICREGRGEGLKKGNNVLINYYMFVEGTEWCVESNKRKSAKPYSVVLGGGAKGKRGVDAEKSSLIELAALSMKVKEVAAFLAEPLGKPAGILGGGGNIWIPTDKRVLCVIEVLTRLASPSESSSIINLVSAERKLLAFEEIYGFAKERKLDGDYDLRKKKNARALRKFFQAVTCLEDASPKTEKDEDDKMKLMHALYRSIATGSFLSGQFAVAAEFAQKAIDMSIPEEQKGYDYFHCARALFYDKKIEESKNYLAIAMKKLPKGNKQVAHLQSLITLEETQKGKKKSPRRVSFTRAREFLRRASK